MSSLMMKKALTHLVHIEGRLRCALVHCPEWGEILNRIQQHFVVVENELLGKPYITFNFNDILFACLTVNLIVMSLF